MKKLFLIIAIAISSCEPSIIKKDAKLDSSKELNSIAQNNNNDSAWYKKMVKIIDEEAKPVFVKATSQIIELRDYVNLAKKGLIKKKDVVKKFNDEVGGYFGYEKTFEGVDKSLIKKGEAYPKLLYLKEKARLFREKAAEMKYELEK